MSLLTDAYVSRQRKMKIMRQGRFKTEEFSFISLFAINTKLRHKTQGSTANER